MPYELDSTPDSSTESDADDDGSTPIPDADDDGSTPIPDESLGLSIPDDHVGAFVAEAFEDPERNTTWDDIVDEMVAADARDAWKSLSPRRRVTEVLNMATEYDERAIERLEAIDTGREQSAVQRDIDEALRCRRNADAFRDGVADAFEDGFVSDSELVAAVEDSEFDTTRIASREDQLERLDDSYDIDFRPYGGTLMNDEEGPTPDVDHDASETW